MEEDAYSLYAFTHLYTRILAHFEQNLKLPASAAQAAHPQTSYSDASPNNSR